MMYDQMAGLIRWRKTNISSVSYLVGILMMAQFKIQYLPDLTRALFVTLDHA